MSNTSFFDGGKYVRDYILASIVGLQHVAIHTSPEGGTDPKYKAYAEVYNLIEKRFGDIFTEFKG